MKPETFLRDGKVYVWNQSFAVIRSRRTHPEAFANIIDHNEITVIMDETRVDEEDVIEIQKGWKLLTFDMVLPFELVGFLATVSRPLQKKKFYLHCFCYPPIMSLSKKRTCQSQGKLNLRMPDRLTERPCTFLIIALFQNGIFTAEAPRTQRKALLQRPLRLCVSLIAF
jgi:hypothetical protein